jgi:choline dehydrogenase
MKILYALLALATAVPAYPVGRDQDVGAFLGSSFGIPGRNRTFDYIIIGGGIAGLTLATRLVEQHAGSVAVIEAGSFYELTNGNLSQIPANDYLFTGKDESDWQPGIDWCYSLFCPVLQR